MKSFVDLLQQLLTLNPERFLDLPREIKRGIVLIVDVSICWTASWVAFYLRLGELGSPDPIFFSSVISVAIAVPVFLVSGLYRIVFRYTGWPAIKAIAIAVVVYASIYGPIIMIYTVEGVPRTVGVLQPLFLFFGVTLSRLVASLWLGGRYLDRLKRSRVSRALIFGAGSAGRELEMVLRDDWEISVVCFVDDDISLTNRVLNGKKIFSSDLLGQIIQKERVTHVFLAIPSASRTRRYRILESLSRHQVVVRTLPSLLDIAGGRISLSDIQGPEIGDLLGREPVIPDPVLLEGTIKNKTVMVTGAGGSIGGELCSQIVRLKPTTLVLVESSEYALYKVYDELEKLSANFPQSNVVPLLCSVQDRNQLGFVFSTWKPDTVYHAAAFKHVPLAECNAVEAVKNNVIGTLNTVQLAINFQVSNFVLVSTDKAVRPANVMGATKRLAEMILQALNQEHGQDIRLSMVRFGNVLASSGSVIPKFQSQIETGGPVTVTHPNVTRYFMTIREAAELVLQAGTLSRGGDVFLLDMGVPIKIMDLARRMITLSGLSVRTDDRPSGDIEIRVTGLRPGEKLFEELLIGDRPQATAHPRIMRGDEIFMPWPQLSGILDQLYQHCMANDVERVLTVLRRLVDGFPCPSTSRE